MPPKRMLPEPTMPPPIGDMKDVLRWCWNEAEEEADDDADAGGRPGRPEAELDRLCVPLVPLPPLGRGGNLVGPVLLVVPWSAKALAAAAAAAAVPADEMEESKVHVLFMLVSLCIGRPLPPKRDRALPPPMFSSDGKRCLVLAILVALPFSAKPPPTSSCSSRGPMLSSRTRAADDCLLLALLALPPLLPDRFRP